MDSVILFMTEPLTYGFMQRALVAALLVGIVCSIFSCFLVLKAWSLMGDAVSHAVLPGIALAYVAGWPLGIGAFIAGLFCSLATGFLKSHSRIKEDAVMGIVFSGMFALGLVMLTRIESDVHLVHILFGNILGVLPADLWEIAAISLVCSAVMLVKRRDLMLYCFDPVQAQAVGLPVRLLHFGMLVLLALTIVSALKAAGVILVIAMLIAPGAIGFLVTSRFDRMLAVAIGVSVFSCLAGTFLSFHVDAATAPLIVVIQTGFFLLALARGRKAPAAKEMPDGQKAG